MNTDIYAKDAQLPTQILKSSVQTKFAPLKDKKFNSEMKRFICNSCNESEKKLYEYQDMLDDE
jgi:hypothetical protein